MLRDNIVKTYFIVVVITVNKALNRITHRLIERNNTKMLGFQRDYIIR